MRVGSKPASDYLVCKYLRVRRNIIYIGRAYNQAAGDTKISCFLNLKKRQGCIKILTLIVSNNLSITIT